MASNRTNVTFSVRCDVNTVFFWYRRWSSLILWLSATPLSLSAHIMPVFFYNVALPFHLLCSHCNILYAMKCAMVLLSVHTFFILECIKIFFLKKEGKKYGISNPFNSFHTRLCYVEQFFWKTLAMRCCLMFFLSWRQSDAKKEK